MISDDSNNSRNCSMERRSRSLSPPVSMFWVLWDILFVSCKGLDDYASTWPQRLHSTLFHRRLLSLSEWLLTSSRQSSTAWSFLSIKSRHNRRKAQAVLLPHIHCLWNIGLMSSPEIAHWLSELPPSFISTLCSLACELLDDICPPSQQKAASDSLTVECFLHLTGAVINIHNDLVECDDRSLVGTLAVPPVLELIKRALAYCQLKEHDPLENGLTWTQLILALYSLMTHVPATASRSSRSTSGSSDLAACNSLSLQPRALTPDWHLISLITRHSRQCSDDFLTDFGYKVILLVVVGWSVTAGDLHDQDSSVLVFMHHCLSLSIAHMQGYHEQPGALGTKEQPLLLVGQQQQQQRRQQRQQLRHQQQLEQQTLVLDEERPYCHITAVWRLMLVVQNCNERCATAIGPGSSGESPGMNDG
ncbi:MAG: hypothetical protein WDW38_010972 [Sanguina aurantia]